MGTRDCRARHPEVRAQAGLEVCTARLLAAAPSKRSLCGLLRVTVIELIRMTLSTRRPCESRDP